MKDNNINDINNENIVNNNNYKYSKLSNNPNEYQDEIKPEIEIEDNRIEDKRKEENNQGINICNKKDNIIIMNNNENNIENDGEWEGNNDLIIEDNINLTFKDENIKDQGMSEKGY